MRILVTGAAGFVGSHLVRLLKARGCEPVAAVRKAISEPIHGISYVRGPDLGQGGSWSDAVTGCSAVIHAAARVHVMRERATDPLEEFRRINVHGTLDLARTAAERRVKRFVFLSSIKVNGEQTAAGQPFRPEDEPAPEDAYGISKREAEDALFELGRATGMEITVVRPPLVYGPGVGANFRALMSCVHRGIPLPLGAISARRSLVAIENLCDLLHRCLGQQAAASRILLVSDGRDLTVPEIIRLLGSSLGIRPRLIAMPPRMLEFAGRLTGQGATVRRLCQPLQVDIAATRKLLNWSPPCTVEEAFERTAAHFLRGTK